MAKNSLTWFEIPVADLGRAQPFYETMLQSTLKRETMAGVALAVFPYEEPGVSGCLQAGPGVQAPSIDGSVVYLDASPSLDAAIERAVGAGGEVLVPRTALPPGMGFFAKVKDLDGNAIGLHALD